MMEAAKFSELLSAVDGDWASRIVGAGKTVHVLNQGDDVPPYHHVATVDEADLVLLACSRIADAMRPGTAPITPERCRTVISKAHFAAEFPPRQTEKADE